MKFRPMKGCRRPVREQRLIWAMLGAWGSLSLEKRSELRLIISGVCADSGEERALFEHTVKGRSPEAAAAAVGMTVKRLYVLKCRLYEEIDVP